MTSRYEGDESKKDIHEKNTDYLMKCREAADYSCRKLGWVRIECAENSEPLSAKEINGKILSALENLT